MDRDNSNNTGTMYNMWGKCDENTNVPSVPVRPMSMSSRRAHENFCGIFSDYTNYNSIDIGKSTDFHPVSAVWDFHGRDQSTAAEQPNTSNDMDFQFPLTSSYNYNHDRNIRGNMNMTSPLPDFAPARPVGHHDSYCYPYPSPFAAFDELRRNLYIHSDTQRENDKSGCMDFGLGRNPWNDPWDDFLHDMRNVFPLSTHVQTRSNVHSYNSQPHPYLYGTFNPFQVSHSNSTDSLNQDQPIENNYSGRNRDKSISSSGYSPNTVSPTGQSSPSASTSSGDLDYDALGAVALPTDPLHNLDGDNGRSPIPSLDGLASFGVESTEITTTTTNTDSGSGEVSPTNQPQTPPKAEKSGKFTIILDKARDDLSRLLPLGKKQYCKFCKNKKEDEKIYSTHVLNDATGRVVCPILQRYICPLCNATGTRAHTVKYCPLNQFDISDAMDRMLSSDSD